MPVDVVYADCIQGFRDPAIRAAFLAGSAGVSTAEQEMQAAGTVPDFSTVEVDRTPAPSLTSEDMSKLYKRQLSRRNSPSRKHYDALRSATPNGLCPLCVQRQVTTLDHYLAKSRFPDLAVTPINLVPSCSDCNKAKLDYVASTAEETTLHPYFDNLDSVIWLEAVVIEANPTGVHFRVSDEVSSTSTIGQRIRNHFKLFGLSELYAAQAGAEFASIRHQLSMLRCSPDGMVEVREWLADRATSCAADNRNSWRTAAFRAWSQSTWFCTGQYDQ